MIELPITEREISQWTDAPVFSPILCASLEYLNIDKDAFLAFYEPCFTTMTWDMYDVKRKQWEAIPETKKRGKEAIFKSYYTNKNYSLAQFLAHFELETDLVNQLQSIQPWRRRSVCSFDLAIRETVEIKRAEERSFEQELEATDIRSLPRVFEQTKSELVENELFYDFMKAVAKYAQEVTPHVNIKKMKMTAHFMSVKAKQGEPGDNSPEGAHEDGADFIISALVISRKHIKAGKSQVFEKLSKGEMVNLFERELQTGEFLFQADTGEEKHYGNDLWHYVTPFYVDGTVDEAWRNIIGLDIVITEPNVY